MDLLLSLNKERGTTLIIVTHDPNIAAQTGRVIRLLDGSLDLSDNGNKSNVKKNINEKKQATAKIDAKKTKKGGEK
jgi:ABC-type lipoprotein export system ATPase subunit